MLNRLRNHELYEHFCSLPAGSELEWMDLAGLQRKMTQSEDSLNDDEIEKILYGTEAAPVFSGFTFSRVKEYLLASGWTWETPVPGDDAYQRLTLKEQAAKPGSGPFVQRIKKIKKREQRRKLKARIRELGCRWLEKLRPALLLQSPLKLNLGAGSESYEGFVKIDWAGPQDVFDDIVILKKIKNNSVDEIYSNHVLEHIPVHLIPQMLKRWHEVLKPGGTLRLRAPDAKQAVVLLGKEWHEVSGDAALQKGFPSYLEKESQFEGIVDDGHAIQFIYGWSDSMPGHWDQSNQHKSLWTPKLGKQRLEAQGFEVVFAENFGTLQTVLIAKK